MQNVKHVRLIALFINFVVSSILLPNNAFVSTAQDRSNALNLEGTEWQKEPDVVAIGTAIADIDRFYAFGGQGKIVFISSAVIVVGYPSRMTGSFPPASAETKTVGKYTQTGNIIHIEFPDSTVKATIKGDVLLAEITYKDTSKAKERWIMHRISNNAGSGTRAPSKQSTMSQSPTLSQQIVEKYKPIPLNTNVISGQLQPENSGKYHYYTFIAGPGEITLTLSLESHPQASTNGVGFTLFDNNERMLGFGMTMSIPGMPDQKITKIYIPSKQPVLLRIEEKNNFGLGKYRLQLGGAFEVETEQKRAADSGGLSVSNEAVGSDKWRAAETLSKQANNLLKQANALRDQGRTREAQGKYRKAVDVFSTVIQIELDTKQYIIDAYLSRALAKLELQDYRDAIEDFSSAIRLSILAEMYYDEQNKMKSSSGNPLIDATSNKINGEVGAAFVGLREGYRGRAIAKSKLGDKAGACEDYHVFCVLMSNSSCGEAKKFCN